MKSMLCQIVPEYINPVGINWHFKTSITVEVTVILDLKRLHE